jgi:steroid 5-alpha reductase family enzyme
LGIYLLQRESTASYRNELVGVHERGAGITLPKKFLIWIGVSLLYVAMFSPSLFHLAGGSITSVPAALLPQALGLLIMIGGLALEAAADRQKSRFKTAHPGQFCNIGVYRLVRCPNYLGEILFWVGNWVVGLAFYTSLAMVIVSLIGLICIVLIMMGSTKRLERAQGERYGSQPAYQADTRNVPILIPFIPLYSLQGIRVYLE